MISLTSVHSKFETRLRVIDSAFDRHAITPTCLRRLDRSAYQEGLISALWQTWCAFCRSVVVNSALGVAVTASGKSVISAYSGRSELEVAFVASQIAQNKIVSHIVPLQGSHLEPTWGDVIKLNKILSGIQISNAHHLQSAFGLGTLVKDLQLARNSSAHINNGNFNKLISAQVRYSGSSFQHPSDFIFWVHPQTKDFAWKACVDEMRIMGSYAVQ